MSRTRIKICGLTDRVNLDIVVEAGADVIGLVFYPKSPRYVSPEKAAALTAHLPPFVGIVGLFVNPTIEDVENVVAQVPLSLIQFHGDESLETCFDIAKRVGLPFIRAYRVAATTSAADLLECEARYRAGGKQFSGMLLDTFVDGYGGGGKVFDWAVIPENLASRTVLSGGLTADNVGASISSVRPFAVDVSSGVELAKGVKDPARIRAFIEAVRAADAIMNS